MQNDNLLRLLSFSNAADCYRQFNNSTVPRIVLFQSQDGRKGAVYIKQFIAAGTSSYVLTDIKVQKEAK
jgi:hypothetical protein